MAEVILEHVHKYFGPKQHVVKDFNLHIQDQEFMVFVGPSGCGKSTILRMIAGLEEVSEGIIRIGNRVVNDVAPKDRDIAMVFQNYALYPHMTVYDNMAFGLKLRGTPRTDIDRQVKQAAATLQIESLLERKPKALSGGQRQRVAMGRAIVREPAVFLMDEPLSNLDAKLRVEMRAQISQLHRRLRTTMIYVTHDQVEAMTLGHRIVVMRDGEIMQVDTPLNLYAYPQNRFVAGFIGSPSMNFLNARREGGQLHVGQALIEPAGVLRQSVQNLSESELVLGIRPEHLSLAQAEDTGPNILSGQVLVVEALGAQTDLLVDASGQHLTAKLDGMVPVRLGDTVHLRLDVDQLHAFHPATELALHRGRPSIPSTPSPADESAMMSHPSPVASESKETP